MNNKMITIPYADAICTSGLVETASRSQRQIESNFKQKGTNDNEKNRRYV